MSTTAVKAPRGQRTDGCLHCVLMTAMEDWFERHGKREDGRVVVDLLHAIAKLTECAVDAINELPERSQRRRAIRFAHDSIDAAVKSARTGKLVPVDVPAEH